MARNFVAASTQQATVAAGVMGATPWTVVFRAKFASLTTNPYPWCSADLSGVGNKYFALRVSSAGLARFEDVDGATAANVDHGTTIVTGTLYSFVFTWSSLSSRSFNFNNLTKVTNGGTQANSLTLGQFTLGSFRDTNFGSSNYNDADISDAAAWSVVLNDEEQKAYMNGVSPLLIRPQSLISYWPMMGQTSPEPDVWKSRNDLTLVNTPIKAEHPRTFRPISGQFIPYSVSAYSLALDIGAYTYTGVAAALKAGRKLALDIGSYTYTGLATALTHGYHLALVVGSYALSGVAATFVHNIFISAVAGAYNLTGSAVSLIHGLYISMTAGVYTISGSAATFIQRLVKRFRVAGSYVRSKILKGSLGSRRRIG